MIHTHESTHGKFNENSMKGHDDFTKYFFVQTTLLPPPISSLFIYFTFLTSIYFSLVTNCFFSTPLLLHDI